MLFLMELAYLEFFFLRGHNFDLMILIEVFDNFAACFSCDDELPVILQALLLTLPSPFNGCNFCFFDGIGKR